jgi:EAL domain-containing protein (putative c-di-GMP-specific phosphodiesterase class I)
VLVRWQHPVLGLLPPQEFIPVAEKSMLIRELSYKLIDRALSQYMNWAASGIHTPLSINLSSRVLQDHDLASTIEAIRRNYHIDASQITLEITESALITDPRRACKVLEELVSQGFCISIDDFGTGYSSLSYLRDFPIHEIKIDKSFVQSVQRDVRNSYIIEAIVGLARAFNATTVAEGIEHRGLWNQMRDMGCDVGQGYAISQPVNATDFASWQHEWLHDGHRGLLRAE